MVTAKSVERIRNEGESVETLLMSAISDDEMMATIDDAMVTARVDATDTDESARRRADANG